MLVGLCKKWREGATQYKQIFFQHPSVLPPSLAICGKARDQLGLLLQFGQFTRATRLERAAAAAAALEFRSKLCRLQLTATVI